MDRSPSSASLPRGVLEQALAIERLRNARQLNAVRLIGVTLFLLLHLAWDARPDPNSERAVHGILALYWLLSLGLFLGGRRWDVVARLSSLAVPFLDMPVVYWIQYTGLGVSTNPRAVANFTLGIHVCLLMLAALSLERWQIPVAALTAISLQSLLLWVARDSPLGRWAAPVVLALAAAICDYALRRRLELVRTLVEAQVRRERLGRYFSPAVAEQIERAAETLEDGQHREVTVLFCDLRDFTALSNRLSSVETVALLNAFHAEMVEVLFAHGGTLDKYTGDGIMAYFGAPVVREDHAESAVRCALAMQGRLEQMSTRRRARGEVALEMGIGVHTGAALIGSIGAPNRREFTAIGDAVNLAARLEQLTKQFSTPIVVSETTRGRVGERLDFHFLDTVLVRGRAEPVRVFRPLRDPLDADRSGVFAPVA